MSGCHFANDQEVKEAVHVWLVTQPKTFFPREYRSLWTANCVAKGRQYIEKLYHQAYPT
jgi:hypothetical protein